VRRSTDVAFPHLEAPPFQGEKGYRYASLLSKGESSMAQAGQQDWHEAAPQGIRQAKAAWAESMAQKSLGQAATTSGIKLDPLYTPADLPDFAYLLDLGMPGEEPYTRGIYPSLYRGRLWTMRMYTGFGTAAAGWS
jgi:Methylmalonyl-CoA mutase